MLPAFDSDTGYLPRGLHPASWAELEARLGFNAERQRLLAGLLAGCREFRAAGARVIYVDGSFATSKQRPNDYDCCYSTEGIDSTALDPVLMGLATKQARALMKFKYMGEFWPAGAPVEDLTFEGVIFDFFQRDKDRHYKGMVELDLSSLP